MRTAPGIKQFFGVNMPGFWNAVKQKIQTALETPFDNTGSSLVSEDAESAIKEVSTNTATSASPGFTWGDVGSATAGTFLENDSVQSSNSGRLVPFDGFITDFFINNERSQGTKIMEILRRRPAQTGTYTPIFQTTLGPGTRVVRVPVNVAVLEEDELAIRVQPGSDRFQNPVVGLILKNNSGSGAVGGVFLQTEDEGSQIEATTTKYNFTGAGVSAVSDGNGNVTVDVPGGGAGSGEANTASNRGTGEALFAAKSGVDLEFKSLVAGSNVSLSSNGDTVTINSSGGGGGGSFAAARVEANANLLESTNIASVTNPSTGNYTVTFTSPAANANYPITMGIEQNAGTDDYFVSYTNVTVNGFDVQVREQDDGGGGGTAVNSGFSIDIPDLSPGGGGGGETNTASNAGSASDADIFKQKTGVDLEFRRLTSGANISITQNADDIVIAASGSAGEVNTGVNVGGGSEVFRDKTGTALNFRTIVGTGDINVTTSGNTIEVGGTFPVVDANTNRVAEAGDVAGGQSVSTTGFANLSFDTFASSAVATASATGVAINVTGFYEISYDYSASGDSNSRSESQARLFLNGTTVISLSLRPVYHRTTAQGAGSATAVRYLQLSSGDTISLQAQRSAGGAPITTEPNGTILRVKYLRSSV